MRTAPSTARLRLLLTIYIVAVALVTVAFALLNARLAHPWIIGEWLINYGGGFLRRGLLGELLLLAHRGTGLPLVGLTAALQVGLYGLFYASLLPLLRGVRWSLPLLALLLSPATLAFTVLDPPTSVRKEILLFVTLSLLAHAVVSMRPRPWQLGLGLSIAGPVLLLTHEGLAAFLPYLSVPVVLYSRGSSAPANKPPPAYASVRIVAVPLLLSALALAAVLSHPGGREQAQAVCRSVGGGDGGQLGGPPGGLCHGAIAYLALTPAQARAETLRAIRFYSYRTRYPLPILLTALPICLLFAGRIRAHQDAAITRALLLATTVALVLSLPLFVVARDWGRWIEIHATCLLLLFLLVERSPEALANTTGGLLTEDKRDYGFLAGLPRLWQVILLALYGTCWTLPAVGIFPGRLGYLDLVRYLHSYRSKPHLSTAASSRPGEDSVRSRSVCCLDGTMQLERADLRPNVISRE